MTRKLYLGVLAAVGLLVSPLASATFIGATSCTGAISCQGPDLTYPIPNPVTQNPNNGVLLIWDERQNVTLEADLPVDRVADPTADYVGGTAGNYYIKAGTIVSSHYVQWDPLPGGSSTVDAILRFDSAIFAFITADAKLFGSDDALGLAGINYNDFSLRGLENGDTTEYPFAPSDYSYVQVNWTASSPGDWTRLITAFSPTAASVPLPAPLWLLLAGVAMLARHRRR